MPKITTVVFAGGTTLLIAGAAIAATLSPSGSRILHMADAPAAKATTTVTSVGVPVPHPASSTVPTTGPASRPATASKPKTVGPTGNATTNKPAPEPTKQAAAKAPITYTVRPGDTLSGVAAWFKLHGYGNLYAANAKVIGANPNLIIPGERITIGSNVMTVQGPA
jgi:hypothetical protein